MQYVAVKLAICFINLVAPSACSCQPGADAQRSRGVLRPACWSSLHSPPTVRKATCYWVPAQCYQHPHTSHKGAWQRAGPVHS